MVPPDSLFGVIPTWVGVYVASIAAFGVAGYFLYQRVFRLVLLGKPADRFDQPVRRSSSVPCRSSSASARSCQRVSLRDRAGLAHFFIFWGFLSFSLSYVLFIYLDSLWHPLSGKILTETGLKAFTIYLDILGRAVPARAGMGSGSTLGLHAQPPEIRPHAEIRVRRHPRADCDAHGLHAAHRGVSTSWAAAPALTRSLRLAVRWRPYSAA